MKKGASDLITGTVQVADRQGHFVRPLIPGSVVVLNAPDLDYELASTLAAGQPRAVLNGADTSTQGGLGAGVLLDAGIVVLDELGPDVMDLRDGQEITVSPQTGEVIRGEVLVASGRTVDVEDVTAAAQGARQRLESVVQARAIGAAQAFGNESDLLLEGIGLPGSRVKMTGRVALVVPPSADLLEWRKQTRRFLGDYHPVIIGVGSGASVLKQMGLRPAVLVGDPRDFDDAQMQRARQVIVPTGGGDVAGLDRLRRHSIACDLVATQLPPLDVALLFAAYAGATTVVDCSAPTTLEQAFDGPAGSNSVNALVATQLAARRVSLRAALSLYRPRISGWWVAALVLAAVLAAIGAFLFTPWGGGVTGISAAAALWMPPLRSHAGDLPPLAPRQWPAKLDLFTDQEQDS